MIQKFNTLPKWAKILFVVIILFFMISAIGSSPDTKKTSNVKPTTPQAIDFSNAAITEENVRIAVLGAKAEGSKFKPEELTKIEITDRPDGNKMINAHYLQKEAWDEKSLMRTSTDTMVAISEALFKNPNVGEVVIQTSTNFTDSYGKSTDDLAILISLKKETAEKIEWSSFREITYVDYQKLLDVADDSYIHPAIRKEL